MNSIFRPFLKKNLIFVVGICKTQRRGGGLGVELVGVWGGVGVCVCGGACVRG